MTPAFEPAVPDIATARNRPTAPRTIGRFEIRSALGRGAQASVWLAFDPKLEREVAVKQMHDVPTHSAYDWKREARNVSRLTHPHVVPVFEADTHEGLPYLVFEFVPGSTLAERLRRDGPMEPRGAVTMMLGVLDALTAAHALQVVHRDLKPSNILVDMGYRARVMDFGIAARLQDAPGAGAPTLARHAAPPGAGPAIRRDVYDDSDGLVVGTPGYMSPEAARGEAPAAAMDVFAAGLVLVEMLSGKPLLRERDPHVAIRRVIEEDLALPADLPPAVDDALRSVLARALARDPRERLPSARAFHDALSGWLAPSLAPALAADAEESSNATLAFLLRRMRHRSDFPAMSDSIGRIQRVASADDGSLQKLAAEVSQDLALTNKLLRLVNTVNYSHSGGGSIATVSRAVALVGFSGVRNMAMSLVLLEGMQDKAHASQLKEEYLRSLMAGTLADELSSSSREAEEAFVGAMFQNLGRLLTEYYLVEEARRIRELTAPPAPGTKQTGAPLTETQASLSVLGMSFDELGQGVAKHWGLPASLLKCMSRAGGVSPSRPATGETRLRWLTTAANEIADALLVTVPSKSKAQVERIAQRHAQALGVNAKDVAAAVERSRRRMEDTTRALDINVPASSPLRRLIDAERADATATSSAGLRPTAAARVGGGAGPALAPATEVVAPRAAGPDGSAGRAADGVDISFDATRGATVMPTRAGTPADGDASDAGAFAATRIIDPSSPIDAGDMAAPTAIDRAASAERLSAGIHAITNLMVADSFSLNAALQLILSTMQQALGFRAVVFCLRDPKTDTLLGRFAVGASDADALPGQPGANAIRAAFRVPLRTGPGQEPDLFTSLCVKGVDSVIADTAAPNIAARLPDWFRESVRAPSFLLLPLMMKAAPFGLIYADKATAGSMTLDARQVALLATLRNQALMAFRQVRG